MPRMLLTAASFSLLLATGAFAQTEPPPNPPGTDTPASTPANAPAPAPAPKKVWTNEDIKHGGGVSVVGNSKNTGSKPSTTRPADAATVTRIRERLQRLQAQLDDVNKQLTAFEEFKQGSSVTTGATEIHAGYTRMPVDQQMAVLGEKKKKLETEIADLYDDARKRGIEPGQLR